MAEPLKANEPKVTKDRSPSFPFIPLKTAVERLETFQKYFGRHPAPASKAGLAWGMKEKSSQADQTLAALRSFGLLKYDGMGLSRQVALTNEGQTYLRAQQDSVKKQVVKQSALRPKIIRKFWTTWGADRPPDAVALDQLRLDHGFSDAGADNFLKVYDDTISFAGLSASDKITPEQEGDEDPDDSAHLPPPPRGKVKVMEGERVVFTEETNPQQYLKLIASGEVDETLLDALQDYVKRQKKRLGLPDYNDPEYLERRRVETVRRATRPEDDEAAN